MINHPFAYDGIVIYGDLAKLYITGASTGFDNDQAPIFLTILLQFTKLLGFSYPKALLGQFLLLIMTHISFLYLYCYIKDKSNFKSDFYKLFLWSLYCFVLFGILKVNPGGLIDFRRDLWGALLLSYAILFMPFFNIFSVLILLLCSIERFHCLPVLVIYCLVLCILKKSYKPSRSLLISIFLYLSIRWNHFIQLIYYYRGHIGISDGSNIGIHGFTERIFYSFYPASLIRNYLGPTGLLSIGIILFLIIKFIPFKKFYSIAIKDESKRAILTGSLVALFLLIFNKTRNNEGVLRYFLVPFSFYWTFLFNDIYNFYKRTKIRTTPFQRQLVPILMLFTILICGIFQIHYLLNYDYKGIKKYNFKTTSHSQLNELYSFTKNYKHIIRAGSNYVSDLNFTEWQWNSFLAENNLTYIPYVLEIGGEYLVSNEKLNSNKNSIKSLNIIFNGSEGCNDFIIPSANSIAKLNMEFKNQIYSSCKETLNISRLENCEIRAFICH